MYQVNRFFIRPNIYKHIFRNVHHRKPVTILYPLESRSLLKVSGCDAPVFLQGLITNDMQHFEEGASSMYAMFLNNKGRVLYDTLIHKGDDNDCFFVECDKNVLGLLQKHLKIYKLKRNVEIGDIGADFKVFALVSSTETSTNPKIDHRKNIMIYKDPRLTGLGYRVIVSIKVNESYLQESLGDAVISNDETGYKFLRYKLGVSEGAEDLPPGVCFPLEANCDYLHGVSFHKGCYIGQELTARVHHTGVVRKRIMPLRFKDVTEGEIEKNSVIIADENKKSNVGKFMSWFNGYGLGLVRIKEALDAKVLKIGKHEVQVEKPTWWPIEAPKEKATAKLE